MFQASADVLAGVRQVVADAAAAPIEAGRAELAVGRLADLVDVAEYDCPVVVLTPVDRDAARIVIEVQADDLWWVSVADGPGTELYAGIAGDRYARLGSMVRSVVAGRYRHGPCSQEVRRLFRPPRRLAGWCETFETDDAPVISQHFGRAAPATERRFQPY